jgi:transcriptional regulator with XRE-family HTH domain
MEPKAEMGSVYPAGNPSNGSLTRPRAGATVVRMVLGAQLRRLREKAGLTPEQAGYEIRASRSKISRLEHGRVGFKIRDVEDLLTLYGLTDQKLRLGLLALAEQANEQGWWTQYSDVLSEWFETYLGLEAAASLIRTFELQFVHGLFQTRDYARAVTMLGYSASPEVEVDRRVELRMARQELLVSPEPPRVWSVMDEAALRRPIGGRDVMRAQLAHLLEVGTMPEVTLQVVPFRRGGHAAAGGSFTILRFAEDDVPDVVYIEQLTSALYLDKREDVDHYLEVMNALSTEALTPAESKDFLADILRET